MFARIMDVVNNPVYRLNAKLLSRKVRLTKAVTDFLNDNTRHISAIKLIAANLLLIMHMSIIFCLSNEISRSRAISLKAI